VQLVTYEKDTEPYAIQRDLKISNDLKSNGVIVTSFCSHTLFDPEHYVGRSKGKLPLSYQGFCKLFSSLGVPREPVEAITSKQMPPTLKEEISDEYKVCSVVSVASIICVVIFFTYTLLAGLCFTCREHIF
jgi:cryptochrome